jgi:hypothetical protein
VGVWLVLATFGLAVDVVCCAAAYRIHCGHRGLDRGWGEVFWRSGLAALGLTVLGLAVLVPVLLVFGRSGQGFLLGACVAIPLGTTILQWAYGLDDWLAALSIFFLRLVPLSALVLVGLGLVLASGGFRSH